MITLLIVILRGVVTSVISSKGYSQIKINIIKPYILAVNTTTGATDNCEFITMASQGDVCKSNPELPENNLIISKTGEKVIFDKFNSETDENGLHRIWLEVMEEGQTYPTDDPDREAFKAFFLSHDTFVIRLAASLEVIAGFYIKPNFPGRSSHIANIGLLVRMDYRGKGLSSILIKRSKKYGRELGYRAIYTNLVYVTNKASINMCLRNGFRQVGRLPEAGNLKGFGYTDALQLYCNLLENNSENDNNKS